MLESLCWGSREFHMCSGSRMMIGARRFRCSNFCVAVPVSSMCVPVVGLRLELDGSDECERSDCTVIVRSLPTGFRWVRSVGISSRNPFYFRPASGCKESGFKESGRFQRFTCHFRPETTVSSGFPPTSVPVPARIRHSEFSTWEVKPFHFRFRISQ